MSVIETVHREREDLARVLKKHSGIRRIVEDLYPDKAHFIYELLQNAEDTGATEAWFVLAPAGLTFEHNGRAFEERDVWAITDVGEGTKAGADDKIGRFGVGFKAVFAYSETPHIWSPKFSFKITDLVLPTELKTLNLGNRTRFEFPFNNPKKPAAQAFAEVQDGLSGLAETVLLFLPSLALIGWRIEGGSVGEIRRVEHADCHVEVIKTKDRKTASRSHFLKFDEPVRGLEKQRVSVAYALDFLPGVENFAANKALSKQLKVVPASPGRVAVFFPAEKESSGLRFHLHAPFVPELSRASIKETPANLPLFDQLADLAAASLHRVRDLKLLTADFLEVLPNSRDQLGLRYDAIRTAIIGAMNDQALTPTHAKSHAPARTLVQGKAALKSLLSDEDIEFLIDYEGDPPRWAVGAAQRNSNADRMLDSLDLTEWDVEAFVALLTHKTNTSGRDGPPENVSSEDVMAWLGRKSAAWHQEFYALLLTEYLAAAGYRREDHAAALGSLRIVRLDGGGHGVAGESFFGAGVTGHDDLLRRVDPETYSTGRAKSEKENARALLGEIGVREVGEAEVVEMILKKRYTREAEIPSDETYFKDLARFVELVEAEPDRASLFEEYFIFQCDSWRVPGGAYLDSPYRETGLNAYYEPLGEGAERFPLSDLYQRCGVSLPRFVSFALSVGAAAGLTIEDTTCRNNPDAARLVWASQGNWSRYGVNADYHIPRLGDLLVTPSVALSRLIWNALCGQDDDSWTTARYRNNSNYSVQRAPSQLACLLKERAWIPQTGGRFVRPCEAIRELLPAGFPFDPGWSWLDSIGFGQQPAERPEEEIQREALARELGFEDDDALERVRRFAALPAGQQQEILEHFERPPP